MNMKNAVIEAIEARQIKTDIPAFNTGDVLKIHQKIIEGKKERIQIFEGVVITKRGKGLTATVTVRKIVDGIGVEKTFPVNSKAVTKIEVVKFGKVRKARLFYLRALIGSIVTRIKEDMEKNIAESQVKAKARKDSAKEREAAAKTVRKEAEQAKIEDASSKEKASAEAKAENAGSEEKAS
jgi:large subunit ribosomal protein L19